MARETGVRQRERWRRTWDRHAATYDGQMERLDRLLFKDTRAWVCGQATGDVLEVAVGTGLNLPLYPADVRLTGIDLSPAMLELARVRAVGLGRDVVLSVGNAEHLALADASYDTVVCTFSCCAIPDHRAALDEMVRVLRPGGLLLLGDHVASRIAPLRWGQRLADLVSVPLAGEHFARRPYDDLPAGLVVERHDRFAAGVVERVVARKPVVTGGGTPAPR